MPVAAGPGSFEMRRAGERRRLEIRHRAAAGIPAVQLHHIVEAGAEMAERRADLAHHLPGLGDDVAGGGATRPPRSPAIGR